MYKVLTPTLFHSKLKTCLFQKSSHHTTDLLHPLDDFTDSGLLNGFLLVFQFF